jgi:hypothetical protein
LPFKPGTIDNLLPFKPGTGGNFLKKRLKKSIKTSIINKNLKRR